MSRLFLVYLFAFVSGLLLTSCKVGPDFSSLPSPGTTRYTSQALPNKTVNSPGYGGKSQQFITGQAIPANWWALFKSKSLNSLIEKGIAHNPTLQAARLSVEQAEQNLRSTFGSLLLPSLNATGTAQRQRFSSASIGNAGPSSIFNLYNASLQASYMLDVFGGLRRQVEAAGAQLDFQFFEEKAAYLGLTSTIVVTAITEAGLRDAIKATQDLIESQEDQLNIISQQFELGGATITDVLSQKTLLAQTRTTLPPLEKNLVSTRNLMATLIGELPSESILPSFQLEELHLPTDLPISVPSLLVKQRPDVQAAEALLHQASANIGVATANLFPQFTLTGSDGSQSSQWGQLFKSNAIVWSLQGQVLQPLFQGGALIAKRRAAILAFEQAYAEYRSVVLKAFQEVADALKAVEYDAKSLKAETEAEAAALEALQITQKQFELGAANYIFILNAQNQYRQTKLNRILALRQRYTSTSLLFQALGGGGWNNFLKENKE